MNDTYFNLSVKKCRTLYLLKKFILSEQCPPVSNCWTIQVDAFLWEFLSRFNVFYIAIKLYTWIDVLFSVNSSFNLIVVYSAGKFCLEWMAASWEKYYNRRISVYMRMAYFRTMGAQWRARLGKEFHKKKKTFLLKNQMICKFGIMCRISIRIEYCWVSFIEYVVQSRFFEFLSQFLITGKNIFHSGEN